MPGRKKSQMTRTRSFPCPDDLWQEVEAFARRRNLGSAADAARALLRSGLETAERLEHLRRAQEWQLAQAVAEVRAIEAGKGEWATWSEVEREIDQARARMRRHEGRKRSARA